MKARQKPDVERKKVCCGSRDKKNFIENNFKNWKISSNDLLDKKIKFDVNTESLEVQDDDGKKKKRRKKKDKNDDKLRWA